MTPLQPSTYQKALQVNLDAAKYGTRRENGHGWLGLRFQAQPGSAASEIIIHVHMLDKESGRAQEAAGIVGVNLIHAASLQLVESGFTHAAMFHADGDVVQPSRYHTVQGTILLIGIATE